MLAAGNANPSATILNLQQAFKLALSVVLLFWLALSLGWDLPSYGALAIVLISLDTTGASVQKGVFRVIGSTFGLAVGMLGLALFAQDPGLTLVYHTLYLLFVGYFIQTSRYTYAWFVAGFLPSLVWASTYGKVDSVFHYAVFRYLETTVGIVIFSVVSMLLWPRSAGDELQRQGRDIWKGLRDLFGMYRRQLEDELPAPDAPALRTKLAGELSRMLATLQTAYADTTSVAIQKRAWEVLRVNTRAVADALELWRQSIADCHRLDLEGLLPGVGASLETLAARWERIEGLWPHLPDPEDGLDTADGDAGLLRPFGLNERREAAAELPLLDRAALHCFAQQLRILDLASRELLLTMRVLAHLTPMRDLDSVELPADLYRPALWDPARCVRALMPASSFVVGTIVWFSINPPTGPSVPSMAATLALALISAPIHAMALAPVLLIPLFLLVAPAYLLLMPKLSTGVQLLTFMFGYVFAMASLLVGRLAPLKVVTLAAFVMLISGNRQGYSFIALVDTGIMLLLGLGSFAVVQTLLLPLHPEQVLRKSVRRFFRGGQSVVSGLATGRPRHSTSVIQSALGEIRSAHARVSYDRFSDGTSGSVLQLIDSLQNISDRLQSLAIASGQFARHRAKLPPSVLAVTDELRVHIESVFRGWASLETAAEPEAWKDALRRRSLDLERQFETVQTEWIESGTDDRAFTDLFALMGSVRGLVDAMESTDPLIRRIEWSQWEVAGF